MPPPLFVIPPGLPHYIRRPAHRALLDIMSKAPHEGSRRSRPPFTPRMLLSSTPSRITFIRYGFPICMFSTHCLALRVLIFVRRRLFA